jgi:diguanylate cyclase (GGDEF)-like protein
LKADAFLEPMRQTSRQLVRLLDALSALRSLSELDIRTPDQEALVRGALASLIEHQDLERCSVYLRAGDRLVNVAGVDWTDLLSEERSAVAAPRRSFQVGEGMVGLAAAGGEIQRCRDVAVDPRFAGSDGATGSLLCVPIRVGDEVAGVLNASHPEPGHFGVDHERLLSVFANFLAQFLTNWRIMHRMEEQIRDRTRALERALAEARELKRRFEEMAVTDELTGLHNRRFFFPEAQAALARAVRYRQPYSVILVDLDHFKRINDDFGHAAGDEALRGFASLLGGLVREGDIVARFGGEEFALALPNTGVAGAVELAERLRAALAGIRWSFAGPDRPLTASLGVCALAEDAEGASQDLLDALLRDADHALYRSKGEGRNRVTVGGGRPA